MFKKFFTLMVVAAIFTTQVQASSYSGLKEAFDEMNYSLTVEWDQNDKTFYDTQFKKFMATVRELQKTGLTGKEMIEFAKTQVKDAKVANDLETAFSMITINRMSSEEASKYMMDSMKRAYSQGASWNGEVVLYLTLGLIFVAAAVGVAAESSGSSDGDSDGSGSGCYDNCYSYDYICGYDYIGYPIYCEDRNCDLVCY